MTFDRSLDGPGPLDGRVALVTGGSRGLGAAIARALGSSGATVVVAARSGEELTRVAAEVGGLAVPTDVRDELQVDALVAATIQRFARLDIVVAAAGLGRFGPLLEASIADWDETISVNLRGTFLLCRAALPHLLANPAGGHVFTLASVAATRAFPGAAAYCASKWGVLGFTRVLAEEVRRQGVKVTALIPGAVDSPFWDASGGTTLPRDAMLRPEHVAQAVLFAASQPPSVHTDEITVMPPGGVL